ncbi:MAG: glycosyltransferase family 4 protein [Candidatus Thorarchaeota archaeon]|nr:glycosyltransferase family 4 protein [Candidatus Thorarchaeota archaeon]
MENKPLTVLVIAKLADRTLDGYLKPIVEVEGTSALVLRTTPGLALKGVTYINPPLALQRSEILSFLWKLFTALRLVVRSEFSCVYAIFAHPHLYLASLISFLSRKPLFYTLIAAEFELIGRGSVLAKLTLKLARRANKIIVSGDKAIQYLLKSGIPPQRIVEYRITSLVDLNAFFPMRTEKPLDLIAVSRLAADKHIDVFVDIVNSIKKSKPDVKAAIVGDGFQMDSLVDYVQVMGLSENIEFHGWVSDQAVLNRLLNSAKILVMNSSHEGGPFNVPEAMAAGLCVVTSDVGEVRKLINHGHNGFIVERPDDIDTYVSIINQLLEDSKRRKEIQQRATEIKDRDASNSMIKFWRKAAEHLLKS